MVKAGADITMRAHPGVLESEQISFRRGRRYRHMKSDEWDKVIVVHASESRCMVQTGAFQDLISPVSSFAEISR